jgi:Phospholipase_D-nuclease N-terminal
VLNVGPLEFAVLALALVGLWIWALSHLSRRSDLTDAMKLIWVAIVVFAPFLGVIAYAIVGRTPTRR